MVPAMHFAALAAALLSSAPIQAQPAQAELEGAALPSAPIPPGTQPGQAELEAALRAHYVRIVSYPMKCRNGPAPGCIKPPKAIKVRNYDCQATGTDAKGGAILFCRVTYIHKGGSLAYVKSPNECVPLRATEVTTIDNKGTGLAWEVALVDHKGKCPGARE